MSDKIKAFPGQPADLDGNRIPCAYCDRAAFTRIIRYDGSAQQPRQWPESGFRTIAMVREDIAKDLPVGEARCLRHLLGGDSELSLAAQREAAAATAHQEAVT